MNSVPRGFADFVRAQKTAGRLVVQPRMGFGGLEAMRAGLSAVKDARACVAGTITLDSYTRVNDYAAARRALDAGAALNGFPIVTHGPEATRRMLDGVRDADFPVQVRHGTALPVDIVRAMLAAGLDATEGGPVSYCLPYSRVPLERSVEAWRECCEMLAEGASGGPASHLESFGGCMLGQLCPPSLLIALSVLEGLFFVRHGLRSVSLSFAQGTSSAQDRAALKALRRSAARWLGSADWHVVLYTFMGVFPQTFEGACGLIDESARVAVHGGCERLIVKTPVEARRIPTVAENVAALERADRAAREAAAAGEAPGRDREEEERIFAEARGLIEGSLELDADLDRALPKAFARGLLDVPFCLHRDNANRSRAFVDERGYLSWADAGRMPVARASGRGQAAGRVRSGDLLGMLAYNQRRYDAREARPAIFN